MSGVLAGALDAALPTLRAEAEALMLDTFEIGDPGEWQYVDGEDVRDFTVDFTTPGRLLTSTAPSESEAGERNVVAISRTLHIPASTPVVASGKHARRTSDGAVFRVLADVTHGSHPKSRRLAVEEALS